MVKLPKRHSLVTQTVEILQAEIAAGRWQDWLPGERALCAKYQVSRNTVRAALAQLQTDRLIRAEHGRGHRVLIDTSQRKAQPPERDVALLMPDPPERLRPSQTLWIDELRALLAEHQCLLRLYYGPQYLSRDPKVALSKLVQQHPHACWILLRSNAATQKWFSQHHPRCLVVGTVHAGLPLAYRDVDHRAACRHAGGVLLGIGHRRIALLAQSPLMAGDLESEAGLKEAVRSSQHAGAEIIPCWHDGSVTGIGHALRRLMTRQNPPSALVVANTYHYLTVWSHLTQSGIRVPSDISIISRDEDLFLSYLVPSPSRYVVPPGNLAKALLRPILEIMEPGQASLRELKLLPEFVQGGTVAACPS